jgi:hypothetical protein
MPTLYHSATPFSQESVKPLESLERADWKVENWHGDTLARAPDGEPSRGSDMDDQRSRTTVIIAAILLLLPALYVGSYLALVLPNGRLQPTGAPGDYAVVYYRAGGDFAATIYWPAEQLDRWLFPGRWNEAVLRFWH